MDIITFKLLIDTGLFILIWIVQLVIYPGFCYYEEANMKQWHKSYTRGITYVVMPLMLSQLGIYGYLILTSFSWINLFGFILTILTWLITFIQAIPLHRDIEVLPDSMSARKKLISINWSRTIIWTSILIISILSYGK
ncbi:MAG: hypothetical protein HKN68_06565 [Saprospiraceae bacterium]|nr:hypothetical protein [Saprospiraceae bacterium]